jgi:hypothetical protein
VQVTQALNKVQEEIIEQRQATQQEKDALQEKFEEDRCYNPKLHHTCLPSIRPTHMPSFPKLY